MSEKSVEYLLTTIDNPFNPFTQSDEWEQFDCSNGYYTTNYLARVLKTPFGLSEEDERIDLNNAIDEIIENDPFGIYIKVKKEDKIIPIQLKIDSGGTA